MNAYFVVEGEVTEKLVYAAWAEHTLGLRPIAAPEEATTDCCYTVAGMGYPQILDLVPEFLREVAEHPVFDRFIVCADAEEEGYAERLAEIETVVGAAVRASDVRKKCPSLTTHVLVQDCCMETWFLGHRSFVRRNPQSETLRRYVDFYDVTDRDPERMPLMKGHHGRADHHYEYLRAAFLEHGVHHLRYSKSDPGHTRDQSYLTSLRRRCLDTDHLPSFKRLVDLFDQMSAKWPADA